MKRNLSIFAHVGLMASLMSAFCVHAGDPWSVVYRKCLRPADAERAEQKGILLFTKENTIPFTQLILSWNAHRPADGYYRFFCQVRDQQTGHWGKWHQMMDWGNGVQQSYLSKSDGVSGYAHVRLELEKHKKSDGFKVKVASKEGAHLAGIAALMVASSDFSRFRHEKNTFTALPAVYVADMPAYSQFSVEHDQKARICSPTSCGMAVEFLQRQMHPSAKLDIAQFADAVLDTALNIYGNWQFNTAQAFTRCNHYLFYPRRLNSFSELHWQLARGIPVILSVRGSLPHAPRPYHNGHLLVVVGWDPKKRVVLCHDPACKNRDGVITHYPLVDFLKAWERSHRLVYWIEPMKGKAT